MRYDFTWDDIKEASGFDESDDLSESSKYLKKGLQLKNADVL